MTDQTHSSRPNDDDSHQFSPISDRSSRPRPRVEQPIVPARDASGGVAVPLAVDPPSPPYTAFTSRQRILIITIASLSATFSGFASNIYFPTIPTMASALHTSVENINLTVTTYMILQAISPTLWGVISDTYGRRITLMCTFVVFLSACIGLALTTRLYQLLILRCLQSFGSASTIAIGAGIVGDVTTREERGGFMGVFQTGLLLPLGPVLGGVFAETLGWRAIFWFLTIYAGVFLTFLAVCFPETLRSLVGNGSINPPPPARAPLEHLVASRDDKKHGSFPSGPLRVDLGGTFRILFLPEVFFVLLFLSLHYATWQMALTAQSALFASEYNLSEIALGLTFLANGLGCMLGSLSTGKLLDVDYRRFKGKFSGDPHDFPIEQARLRTLWLWAPFQWGSVLLFGWTIDRHVHLAAPIVATFGLAWTSMSTQSVITTYLVDIFPKRSASATAAVNLARCLMGAGATASVNPTIAAIGVGWTFTLWTGLMALSLVFVAVEMRYGAIWRKRREAKETQGD